MWKEALNTFTPEICSETINLVEEIISIIICLYDDTSGDEVNINLIANTVINKMLYCGFFNILLAKIDISSQINCLIEIKLSLVCKSEISFLIT